MIFTDVYVEPRDGQEFEEFLNELEEWVNFVHAKQQARKDDPDRTENANWISRVHITFNEVPLNMAGHVDRERLIKEYNEKYYHYNPPNTVARATKK